MISVAPTGTAGSLDTYNDSEARCRSLVFVPQSLIHHGVMNRRFDQT